MINFEDIKKECNLNKLNSLNKYKPNINNVILKLIINAIFAFIYLPNAMFGSLKI